MFGRLPWFAFERRRRALRLLVFFDIGRQHTADVVESNRAAPRQGGPTRISRGGNRCPTYGVVLGGNKSQDFYMSTTELTMATFEDTVTADGITLVDFWAEWCGPCKMFGPIFEETAAENPDCTFAKVDTEANQDLAGALGIMSIPTLMIFRDGIQLFAQPGALPKSALDDLLSQVRALDMDEIRSQLAEESSDSGN